MKFSLLAGLALLVSFPGGVLAQGRHSSSNKMRHLARSPWEAAEYPQAPAVGYDTCVQQCMAGSSSTDTANGGVVAASRYGYMSTYDPTSPATPMSNAYGSPPPLPSPSISTGNSSTTTNATAPGGLVAGPYQVIVAPKQGDLRMVPFNINVPEGQNVTFLWGAGPHTVTQSSALEICNASQAVGAWKSGMQNAGFEYQVAVSSNSTQTYFCAVPNHCQKGMFGLINGLTVAVPEGSFGQAMPQMAANDSGLMSLWNETKTICKDSPSAWSWGDKLATSQFPDWALPIAMENILATRQFLATNPQGVSNSSIVPTVPSSPVSTGLSAGVASPSQSSADPLTGSSSSTFHQPSFALLTLVLLILYTSI